MDRCGTIDVAYQGIIIMRSYMIAASLLAIVPSVASAQATCEERRTNRTVGTVAGAGIGGVLGAIVAGRGNNGLGAVLGAVGGGVAGNQLTKSNNDCQHAYGYYDNNSQWHANRVDTNVAQGYYDRDGRWVVGAPAGSYDRNGQWIQGDAARGYRDRNGYWVPANAQGYYAADGTYVTAQPNGYRNDGRDARNAYGQSGYQNDGRDDRDAYGQSGYQGNAPRDTRERLDRISARIDTAANEGTLTRNESIRARRELASIRATDRSLRYRGQLSARNEQLINTRLDRLNQAIRATRQDARAGY